MVLSIKSVYILICCCLLTRFHGGYTQIYGGWAGNSFIALTGGVAERVDMDDIKPPQLFKRVKNALKSGSVIACSVPVSINHVITMYAGKYEDVSVVHWLLEFYLWVAYRTLYSFN